MGRHNNLNALTGSLHQIADLLQRWPIFRELSNFVIESSGPLVVASCHVTHAHTLVIQIGTDGAKWAMLAGTLPYKPSMKRLHHKHPDQQMDLVAAIEAAMKTQKNQYLEYLNK